jgi:hypothetical protein
VLPDADVAQVRAFCADRIPSEVAHQVRLEVEFERSAVVIVERRAPWRKDFGPEWSREEIARFRWTATKREWMLQSPDRGGWRRYDGIGSTPAIGPLLAEVERDPYGIFWG